jgi:hypothetical protein
VPGGVRGQGRGARAAGLRPRLPRALHRRLAPAAPHLPGLPRLPARQGQRRQPRRAARTQRPRRRRRRREGGLLPGPRVLVRRHRVVTASAPRAPDGHGRGGWPAGDRHRRARLPQRPEPCCCCCCRPPFSLRRDGEAERERRRRVGALLGSAR